MKSIISNCHIRVAFCPNKIETAEVISKMCGVSRGENGIIQPIKIQQGGQDRALTDFVEADTTVEFSLTPKVQQY